MTDAFKRPGSLRKPGKGLTTPATTLTSRHGANPWPDAHPDGRETPRTIIIGLKPVSWNKLARKHWRVYQRIYAEWTQATWAAVRAARLSPVLNYPVQLVVTARWTGRRTHDVDGTLVKPVIDTLVRLQILQDDALPFVSQLTLRGETGAPSDSLEIQIIHPRA